ncbi:hypothetical protein L596_023729 [Steinernema carpocapsae]|uniref:Hexosyltransferase n=1 Tax=Steinernema carpocapsae TaxID=34508 RepID=A0A4U5MES0_STECR|nr:hypothetical protein L596_023729 [Steinernema carpocapsae]
MRLQWVLRNFWKYAAVVSLFFLTVDIVFLRPKEVVRLSDSEQTQEILDSFSSPNVKNESAGQFLGKDWTIDIGTRRLFARKNPKCGKTVELLIGVISHANETQMRRDVRNSWASKTSYNTSFTQILFLVGRTENSTCTTAEALEFNDIIYVDVNESYYNLSMKTYALLRYQREFCLQARCTLKIDSDVVANVAGMERLCRSQNDTPVVTGHCKNEWLPLMREVESKYYVPRFIYAQDNYPPYCYGAAYMYSGHRVADPSSTRCPRRRSSARRTSAAFLKTRSSRDSLGRSWMSLFRTTSDSAFIRTTIRIGVLMARVQRRSSSTARRSRFPSGRK